MAASKFETMIKRYEAIIGAASKHHESCIVNTNIYIFRDGRTSRREVWMRFNGYIAVNKQIHPVVECEAKWQCLNIDHMFIKHNLRR